MNFWTLFKIAWIYDIFFGHRGNDYTDSCPHRYDHTYDSDLDNMFLGHSDRFDHFGSRYDNYGSYHNDFGSGFDMTGSNWDNGFDDDYDF